MIVPYVPASEIYTANGLRYAKIPAMTIENTFSKFEYPDVNKNYLYPSQKLGNSPGWDDPVERPTSGFYRAGQFWHPNLGIKFPNTIPGKIVAIYQPCDLELKTDQTEIVGQKGQTATVTVNAENHSGFWWNTTLAWKWKDEPNTAWRVVNDSLGLASWGTSVPVEVGVAVPETERVMQVFLNHTLTKPAFEQTYNNNIVEIAVKPNSEYDIKVEIVPGRGNPWKSMKKPADLWATIKVTRKDDLQDTLPVRLSIDGDGGPVTEEFNMEPGGRHSYEYHIQAYSSGDYIINAQAWPSDDSWQDVYPPDNTDSHTIQYVYNPPPAPLDKDLTGGLGH